MGVAAAVALGVAGVRIWASHRLNTLRAEPGADHWRLLDARPDGYPAVLAFSTRTCAECRVQDRVLERLSGVRVFSFDAHDRADVASRFGVLTVPATVVLHPDGTVAAMNHGFASADKLRDQLEPLAPPKRVAAG